MSGELVRDFNNIHVRSFILTGAPEFNDLLDGILDDRLSRKHDGSSDQEVIGRFVAFLSGRAFAIDATHNGGDAQRSEGRGPQRNDVHFELAELSQPIVFTTDVRV
jgi:hypothetical protein